MIFLNICKYKKHIFETSFLPKRESCFDSIFFALALFILWWKWNIPAMTLADFSLLLQFFSLENVL